MEYLPEDPAILVSSVNILLCDEEFDPLEPLCYNSNEGIEKLKANSRETGHVYSKEQCQFRPIGLDE